MAKEIIYYSFDLRIILMIIYELETVILILNHYFFSGRTSKLPLIIPIIRRHEYSDIVDIFYSFYSVENISHS